MTVPSIYIYIYFLFDAAKTYVAAVKFLKGTNWIWSWKHGAALFKQPPGPSLHKLDRGIVAAAPRGCLTPGINSIFGHQRNQVLQRQ
jgi:hypothetical protein